MDNPFLLLVARIFVVSPMVIVRTKCSAMWAYTNRCKLLHQLK